MTYLLLYINFSRYKLAFFTKTLQILTFSFKRALVKQIIIKLSLVCHNPYLSCLCVSAKRDRKRANKQGVRRTPLMIKQGGAGTPLHPPLKPPQVRNS